MKTITTYTLAIPGRPISINKPMHWRRWAAETLYWRTTAEKVARTSKIPPLPRVKITACPWLKGRREQDVGACVRGVKGAIDGLVDAGILADDTPEYVLSLEFLPAALQAETDELVLTLEVVA